jgi:hypothetical protein
MAVNVAGKTPFPAVLRNNFAIYRFVPGSIPGCVVYGGETLLFPRHT